MSEDNHHNNDEIPVLSEVVFPGNPDKIREKLETDIQPEPEPELTVKEELEHASSDGLNVVKPEPPDVSFIEDDINDAVEIILQRHMDEARKEIVKTVMKELHSRLEP